MATKLTSLIDLDRLRYFYTKLQLIFAGKVDKVDGKGLSSNDYTTEEKTKVAGIETGAQVNTIEGVQVNGTTVLPVNKIVNIQVADGSSSAPLMDGSPSAGAGTSWARSDHVHPTDTTRAPIASPEFTGTPTAPTAAVGTSTTQLATTAFVQNAISGLGTVFDFKGAVANMAALPSSGNKGGDVYHVTADGGEYFWNASTAAWEAFGNDLADLSGYVQESDTTIASTAQIDALFTQGNSGG